MRGRVVPRSARRGKALSRRRICGLYPMPASMATTPPRKHCGRKGIGMASSAMNHTVDVLVVGSGAGAMTAALAAARAGLDTLIIEKANVYRGSSATSGGAAWVTRHHLVPGVGT